MAQTRLSTRLFEQEGKQNLRAAIRVVARAAQDLAVEKIVVFTTEGDGPLQLSKKLTKDKRIIAVTFPHEMTARAEDKSPVIMGLPDRERRLALQVAGVAIVQGTMPFHVSGNNDASFDAVRAAFGTLGGGAQMCVQAVLMACDAGQLDAGERCIAMSADTAIVARSGHSFNFFRATSTFAIEHFLCKPQYYQITRGPRELSIAKYYEQTLVGTDAQADEGGALAIIPAAKHDDPVR